MAYSYDRAAAWIVTIFTGHPGVADLNVLKRMIAADLLYAYEQGKQDSAAAVCQDQTQEGCLQFVHRIAKKG